MASCAATSVTTSPSPSIVAGADGSFDVGDSSSAAEPAENIKVVVRCRPLSKKELDKNCKMIVEMDLDSNTVTVSPPENASADHQVKSFSFDHVFHTQSTQENVYNAVARPIVQNVLEGYNGTIFAYGQTGTGKTFTMEGLNEVAELKGIIPNSFAQIFSSIAKAAEGQRYLVRCSYLEIYNENIRDLLSKDQTHFLELKENKDREVYVKDLTSIVVIDAEDMDRVMKTGNKNRSVASTQMNHVSSRSHAIFSIVVECSTDGGTDKGSLRMGKLNLVDLAGSERLNKTHATGDRLKEATKINLSLSNLGNVISALVDGSSYIPYRNSKLTRLLQDSLGGNSKTVMVAAIGPADYNYDETINTLRYANRAKNIQNHAKINEDPKDAILRQYQEEILRLRALLEQKKIELHERSQQKPGDSPQSGASTARKKKNSTANSNTVEDQSLGTLLEEQNRIEEKYKNELRALLEPYGINVDGSPKGIIEELERRKDALLKDGEEVKEGNKRLYDELEQTTKAMMDSKRQCKELFHRVVSLESQLQKSQVTNEELKSKERELAEQNLREATLRKTLEQKKLTSNDLKEELNKLHQEIEVKQKRITRLRCKVGEHNEKMQMLNGDHKDNLKQLQMLKEESARDLKLKTLIVDNFVPRKIRKKIEDRIRYDANSDKYILAPRTDTTFERPPVNRMLVNPYLNLTRFPRLPKQNNVYYSNENLLAVEPEQPIPRSQDLVLEEEDPAITNLIAETMRELNQELVIVCDHRKGRHKSNC